MPPQSQPKDVNFLWRLIRENPLELLLVAFPIALGLRFAGGDDLCSSPRPWRSFRWPG